MAHAHVNLVTEFKLADRLIINLHNEINGPYALPASLREAYKLYANLPTTKAEALAQNMKSWNGLQVAISGLAVSQHGLCSGDLVTLPYLYSKAINDLYKMLTPNVLLSGISPNFVHASILVPVEYKGDFYLVGQIRGHVGGSGEIQAALAAGGMEQICAVCDDFILCQLEDELMEEVGITLEDSGIKAKGYKLLVHEPEVGRINFGMISQVVQLETITNVFQDHYDSITSKGEKPECDGLVLIPLSLKIGDVICDAENSRKYIGKNLIYYDPEISNFAVGDFRCRYLTQAVIDWLQINSNYEKYLR